MFTGLIQEVGKVASFPPGSFPRLLKVSCSRLIEQVKRGDSVAISGVCLTAVQAGRSLLAFEVSEETCTRSTLRKWTAGQEVNLELALRVGDRLGGHIVLGHVDGTVEVVSVRQEAGGKKLRLRAPEGLRPLIVEKGSVALDGVSLTVSAEGRTWFEVVLIPETIKATTLPQIKTGDAMNIEVDILGRYISKIGQGRERIGQGGSTLSRDFLAEHGFI